MITADKAKAIIPTDEQKEIIHSQGNIKVNSCAGSGKTSSIRLLCESNQDKTLVLVFNKHNKVELDNKMRQYNHVDVSTMHSLAFKLFGSKQIKFNDISLEDIVVHGSFNDLFSDRKSGELYLLASLVKKCFEFYCASNARLIEDCGFHLAPISKNNDVIADNIDKIYESTKRVLGSMRNQQLNPTFSYVLKFIQLMGKVPSKNYKRILFDEAQDLNPCMLDIFLKSPGRKILLGDSDQSIYSWRYTINAFDVVKDFKEYQLTKSFRFGKVIAKYSNEVLKWKSLIDAKATLKSIDGIREPYEAIKPITAFLSKSGQGLLVKALEKLYEYESFYFEGGNLNAYLHTNEGNGIMDVWRVYAGRQHEIKNPLLKNVAGLDEVVRIGKSIKDPGLIMFSKIVQALKEDTPESIDRLRDKTLEEKDRNKADVIFSNVHRAKGYEYDRVVLLSDFITKSKLKEEIAKGSNTSFNLIEEINLLYVAMTRSKGLLSVPKQIFIED